MPRSRTPSPTQSESGFLFFKFSARQPPPAVHYHANSHPQFFSTRNPVTFGVVLRTHLVRVLTVFFPRRRRAARSRGARRRGRALVVHRGSVSSRCRRRRGRSALRLLGRRARGACPTRLRADVRADAREARDVSVQVVPLDRRGRD